MPPLVPSTEKQINTQTFLVTFRGLMGFKWGFKPSLHVHSPTVKWTTTMMIKIELLTLSLVASHIAISSFNLSDLVFLPPSLPLFASALPQTAARCSRLPRESSAPPTTPTTTP